MAKKAKETPKAPPPAAPKPAPQAAPKAKTQAERVADKLVDVQNKLAGGDIAAANLLVAQAIEELGAK
jgi:hypothetical protein